MMFPCLTFSRRKVLRKKETEKRKKHKTKRKQQCCNKLKCHVTL